MRWRRGRRKRGSKCNLSLKCSRVVLVTKAIVSSPVNKEKEKEEEEEEKVEENQQEEEDKIKTTMQSSVAMLQSCSHGSKQLFLSSKQGSGGNHNSIQSSVPMQQSCTRWPKQL